MIIDINFQTAVFFFFVLSRPVTSSRSSVFSHRSLLEQIYVDPIRSAIVVHTSPSTEDFPNTVCIACTAYKESETVYHWKRKIEKKKNK